MRLAPPCGPVLDTDRFELDERGHLMWGVPNTGTIAFETPLACIPAKNLDRVRAASLYCQIMAKIGAQQRGDRCQMHRIAACSASSRAVMPEG